MSELQARFDALTPPIVERRSSQWGAPSSRVVDKAPITSQVVDLILEYAIIERASDIHIEPSTDHLRVRYRIDGQLFEVLTIKDPEISVLARIKIMAGLATDTMAKRKSQDGRFHLSIGNGGYDFRLSTFPTVNGEKMAIRILSEGVGRRKLESIGLDDQDLAKLSRLMQHKHGILLVTGPTGSGKTSTLYALLNKVNSPKVNIITLEEPVEYQIPGMNQCDIKTKSDFSFAEGLKATLRQDPNIILVGEMRDKETAEIAIRASLTGHLVVSTLHANSAIGTVTRLVNLGLDSYMVSYALIGAVAQRLVRAICDQCRTPYALSAEQISQLRMLYGITPDMLVVEKSHAKTSDETGMMYLSTAEDAPSDTAPAILFKGAGCDHCRGTGYRGRIGIFEVVVFDNEIRDAIIRGASTSELMTIAVKQGTRSLAVDALEKVKKGLTTFEEVGSILLEK